MKKTKCVFKGRLISLVTQKTRLPNGYEACLEIVKHPGAVLIVPFLNNDTIILLRQFRPVVNTYIYELPAGTLKKRETPFSCAKREIAEETGFSARKLTKLGFVYPVPGYSTEKITFFKAEGLNQQKDKGDKDEIIEILPMGRQRVMDMFKSGKFVDAKTICALALCEWL